MTARRFYDGRAQWVMLALLTAALALTAVLFRHAYGADRARQRAVDRAMRDYAGFAAWQLGRRLQENVVTTDVLAFVRAGGLMRPPASGHALTAAGFADAVRRQAAECRCLDGAIAFVRFDAATGFFQTEPAAAALDPRVRWVRDSAVALAATMRRPPLTDSAPPPPKRDHLDLHGASDASHGVPRQGELIIQYRNVTNGVLYARAADDGGPPLASPFMMIHFRDGTPAQLYALVVPARPLVSSIVARVLASERLLPNTFTGAAANDSLLRVRVATADGVPLYENASRVPLAYSHADTLERAFGRLRVDVAVAPWLTGPLTLPGDTPLLRLPVLVALMVAIAALLGAAALQLQRQQNFVRMRSEFVAGVSHELRTPLAQIRLLTELLRMGKPDSERGRERSLQIIDQESRRLSFLVENILAFSRAPAGARATLSLAPVRLREEVSEAVEAFAPLAQSNQSHLVFADDGPDPVVALDRAAFRQVLVNLLDNAVRYGGAGQTVAVRLHLVGDAARVSVEDEGPGIPADQREQIWEPYYRLPRDEAAVHGGSGLGLAVVADIVARHGGRAWAESRRGGGGARFVVELPVVSMLAPAAPPPLEETHATPPTPPPSTTEPQEVR